MKNERGPLATCRTVAERLACGSLANCTARDSLPQAKKRGPTLVHDDQRTAIRFRRHSIVLLEFTEIGVQRSHLLPILGFLVECRSKVLVRAEVHCKGGKLNRTECLMDSPGRVGVAPLDGIALRCHGCGVNLPVTIDSPLKEPAARFIGSGLSQQVTQNLEPPIEVPLSPQKAGFRFQ